MPTTHLPVKKNTVSLRGIQNMGRAYNTHELSAAVEAARRCGSQVDGRTTVELDRPEGAT